VTPFESSPGVFVDRATREQIILTAVHSRDFDAPFAIVTSKAKGHTGQFRVFADALKVGGVRVNVSAALEQQIADLLGCCLLTPMLADLRWLQRGTKLQPMPRPITLDTKSMVDQSAKVDAAIAKAGGAQGIVDTVGKHWVISRQLPNHVGRAENYGWHFVGPTFDGQKFGAAVTPPLRLIQDQGWAHDASHTDYSQICVLVDRRCMVDGVQRDLRDVLRDPELSWLVSHDGPLSIVRQPGVPEVDPMSATPPRPVAVAMNGDDPIHQILERMRIKPESKRETIGAVAGCTIGVTIGFQFGGFVPAFIGGFIGSVAGKFIAKKV
jgi:hypothetical protein